MLTTEMNSIAYLILFLHMLQVNEQLGSEQVVVPDDPTADEAQPQRAAGDQTRINRAASRDGDQTCVTRADNRDGDQTPVTCAAS